MINLIAKLLVMTRPIIKLVIETIDRLTAELMAKWIIE